MVSTFEHLDQLVDKALILKKDDQQIIKEFQILR